MENNVTFGTICVWCGQLCFAGYASAMNEHQGQ